MKLLKSKKTYWLFALLCAAMWGSGAVCIKLCYGYFSVTAADTGSQLLMSGVRFMLAFFIIEAFTGITKRSFLLPRTTPEWGHTLLLSLTQVALLYGLYSIGTAHASGTVTSAINGTSTFFTILFATFVFRTEKMTVKKAAACLLGFGAVLLMNLKGTGSLGAFSFLGEGLLLLSQCSAGLSHNITKKFTATDDPVMLTAWQLLIGGAALALGGLLLGGRLPFSAAGWGLLLYLGFVSGTAFSLWGLLMKYHGVTKINIFMLANPVFGVLFSALLLGETAQAFAWQTLTALGMIAAGIVMVNISR